VVQGTQKLVEFERRTEKISSVKKVISTISETSIGKADWKTKKCEELDIIKKYLIRGSHRLNQVYSNSCPMCPFHSFHLEKQVSKITELM